MRKSFHRHLRRLGAGLKPVTDHLAGRLMRALIAVMGRFDRVRLSDALAAILRRVGPWLAEHRIGRANLAAAFPEKSAGEIEAILAGVWENLGRTAAEFAHLHRLVPDDLLHADNLELEPATIERFFRLRDDGQGALVFAAHLGNWELAAVLAAKTGIDNVVLYRRPNIGAVADAVTELRKDLMGTLVPTRLDAPLVLGRAIEAGSHVGMLVDQHYTKGVAVTFFGRSCLASPLIAKLAREFECPIHGIRVVRLPRGRFRAELTEAVTPARDAEGKIDVKRTMQVITSVIEGWVREYPEQWLWLHRRWRDDPPSPRFR
jgi:KDO2-lipid IV(A) lauroyltransferase